MEQDYRADELFRDKSVIEVMQNIAQRAVQPNNIVLATVIGMLLALFGASRVFSQV